MALSTSTDYRKQVMYSVYIRNHTPEGTFQALRRDLERIRGLGVDIIWLMPIHPIGTKARKGTLGSPYAISDYRAVNPEYGTMEDFVALVADIHNLGMKCIIDVVYNHTSPDSWLVEHHPEWFYHKPDGSFGNHVGDWSDIVDLDYTNKDLWDYQIETLKQWAAIVDGFRCDVAPLLPIEFWEKARQAVEQVRPGCLWLSESVEPGFIDYLHGQGLIAHNDAEMYRVFDVTYDYDIWGTFRGYLTGERTLRDYAEAVNRQEERYPGNYVKLRYLENHDNDRAAQIIPDRRKRLNWTAFQYFQKGMALLYGGQEVGDPHRPDLFDKDTVRWDTGLDDSNILRRMAEIKKTHIPADSQYQVKALPDDVLQATHESNQGRLTGIFFVEGLTAQTDLPDGIYHDLLYNRDITIENGQLNTNGQPVILKTFK